MPYRILMIRLCLPVLLAIQLAGCKVQIDVPTVGEVKSQSGNFSCNAGQSCVINIEDANFDESFDAMPKPGYEFSHWRQKLGSFCGNTVKPCRLSTLGFEKYPLLLAFLKGDYKFYIEPVYKPARVAGDRGYRAVCV